MLTLRIFKQHVYFFQGFDAFPVPLSLKSKMPWLQPTTCSIHKRVFSGHRIEFADYARTVHVLQQEGDVFERLPQNILALTQRPVTRDEFDRNRISCWADLYPFQQIGVEEACRRRRLMIADDMGLGKTMQGVGFLQYFASEGDSLVVCPAAVKASWQFHLDKYGVCSHVVQTGRDVFKPGANIVSYGMFTSDLFAPQWEHKFANVVVDESHYTKHASSVRAQRTFLICKKAPNVLLLTGTPMNKSCELYTQIKCVQPTLFGRFHHMNVRGALDGRVIGEESPFYFANRYCSPRVVHIRNRKHLNFDGFSHGDELNFVLRKHVLIRRTKADVLRDLPEKVREQVIIANNIHVEEQQDFMEMVRETAVHKLPFLIKYTKDILVPELENGGHKVLLWAHHHVVLDALESCLSECKVNTVRMDGKTSLKTREERVQAFQSNPEVRVALLGLTAMATGVTLTAATLAIKCELAFSPDVHMQAEDRMHRIGQTQPVFVRYLMVKGKTQDSTDEKIWNLLSRKILHASVAVDGQRQTLQVTQPC